MEKSLTHIALFAALIAVLGLVPKVDLMSGVPITAQPGFPADSSLLSNALNKSSIKGTPTLVWIVVALFILMFIVDACSDDCDDVRSTFGASSAEYQQCKRSGGSGVRSGGSYGGWSSGGGHK